MSVLHVHVLQGRGLPGAVTVAVGDTQQSTRSVPDWSPTWDERFEFPWAGDVDVHFSSQDGTLWAGSAVLNTRSLPATGPVETWVPLLNHGQPAGELLVGLERVEKAARSAAPEPPASAPAGRPMRLTLLSADVLLPGDYYATLDAAGQPQLRTMTAFGSATPQWEESFLLALGEGDKLTLTVQDAICNSPVGAVSFKLRDLAPDIGFDVQLPLRHLGRDAGGLVVRLDPRDRSAPPTPAKTLPAAGTPPRPVPAAVPSPQHIPPASTPPKSPAAAAAAGKTSFTLKVVACERLPRDVGDVAVHLSYAGHVLRTAPRPCAGDVVPFNAKFPLALAAGDVVEVAVEGDRGVFGRAVLPLPELAQAAAARHQVEVEVGDTTGAVRGYVVLEVRPGPPLATPPASPAPPAGTPARAANGSPAPLPTTPFKEADVSALVSVVAINPTPKPSPSAHISLQMRLRAGQPGTAPGDELQGRVLADGQPIAEFAVPMARLRGPESTVRVPLRRNGQPAGDITLGAQAPPASAPPAPTAAQPLPLPAKATPALPLPLQLSSVAAQVPRPAPAATPPRPTPAAAPHAEARPAAAAARPAPTQTPQRPSPQPTPERTPSPARITRLKLDGQVVSSTDGLHFSPDADPALARSLRAAHPSVPQAPPRGEQLSAPAKYTNGGGPYPGAPAAAGPEGLWRGAAASAAPGGLARTYGGGGGAGPATLAPFEQFPVAASVIHWGAAGDRAIRETFPRTASPFRGWAHPHQLPPSASAAPQLEFLDGLSTPRSMASYASSLPRSVSVPYSASLYLNAYGELQPYQPWTAGAPAPSESILDGSPSPGPQGYARRSRPPSVASARSVRSRTRSLEHPAPWR